MIDHEAMLPIRPCEWCGIDVVYVDLVRLARLYCVGEDIGENGPGPAFIEVHSWAEEDADCLTLREHTVERCAAKLCGDEIGPTDPEDGPGQIIGAVTLGCADDLA